MDVADTCNCAEEMRHSELVVMLVFGQSLPFS